MILKDPMILHGYATVSLKNEDWDLAGEWMWENRNFYNGLAIFPFWSGDTSHPQLPLEDITKEKYESLIADLMEIDLSEIEEITDETN